MTERQAMEGEEQREEGRTVADEIAGGMHRHLLSVERLIRDWHSHQDVSLRQALTRIQGRMQERQHDHDRDRGPSY